MTNTQQASSLAAHQAAQTITYPSAHKDNATYIRYLTIKDVEGPRDEVASVLDRITNGIPRKKAEDQKKIRDAARMVLANLVHCIYQRKWLALPTKPELFNKGGYLHDQLYLSHRPTMAVLDRLREIGWLLPAVSGNNLQHISTMHCPTPELENEIFRWLYLVSKPFSEEYIFASYREDEANSKKKVFLGSKASPDDLRNMKVINEHLKEQSYALHGPQSLIYLDEPDMPVQGGRVYMDLQRLPDKKAKVRLNTLINGRPVVEIDLKANHLRMAAALFKEELPNDPYEEIVKITGYGRDVVKSAINRSLGSDHAGRVIHGARYDEQMPIDNYTFRAIITETERIYPFVPFNKGIGVMLQSLEGQIMINAQLRLIELGITALPIHDALMVNSGMMVQAAAEQVLKECWAEHLEVSFYPAVETDSI
jgi:hypothetical protein